MLIFEQSVDLSGRCETPSGEGVTGDPAESEHLQRKSTDKINTA